MQNEPTDLEVAWAAGLFEGEGCFSVHRSRGYAYGRASLKMADEDVVRRFQSIVGCGAVYRQVREPAHRKVMWCWAITNRRDYSRIVALFRPWMGERRSRRLEEIADEVTPVIYDATSGLRSHCKAGHELTPDNIVTYEHGDRLCRICYQRRRRAKRRRAAARRGSWAGV